MNEMAVNQRERILKFVSDAYDLATKDGTAELELAITIRPMYEKFEVRKEGVIRRGVKDEPSSR